MEHIHDHHHLHQHSQHDTADAGLSKKEDLLKLATSATLHCLLGCGIGEVLGIIIATYWGLSMLSSMIIGIVLGFIFGFALGIIPLLRKGFTVSKALKIVILAEGLSIVVMEAFEAFTQLIIPGVMMAGLTDSLFWIGMLASLAVGFVAALPVNYIMIKRGVRHHH